MFQHARQDLAVSLACWLAFFKARCHLFRTGSEVLFLDKEFLYSVICVGCFGKVCPTLEIITDPCDKL